MFKNNKLTNAVRFALVAGAASATLSMPSAFAEETIDAPTERISVTGSRILREGAIAPSPVTVISGADLINTGALNIGEALNELPALANTFSLSNSGRFIGTAGLNVLDLRNMGTDRTLVLVNGKRHVSSQAGSSSVDTNTIPSTWIERVEIITGGASAVYGADAVTGVVNFILKDNIEGLEVSIVKGFADDNPYNNTKYTFSYGQNFDEDKGNVAVAVEYSEQDRLRSFDRDIFTTPYAQLTNTEQTDATRDSLDYPDDIYTPNAGHFLLNNAGVFEVGDDAYSFNPNGSLRQQYLGDNIDGIRCSDCDVFNLGQFTDIQPKFDRLNVNVKVNYNITEDHNFYASAKFAKIDSDDHGQPAFFFFNPDLEIKRDNAFLSDEVGQFFDDNNLDSITLNRMMTDLGVRIENDERETKQFIIGVDGQINDDWGYDVSATYGVTDHTRTNSNNLILANFDNALDAVDDGNGNIVCRDAAAQASGCVPINVLGFGAPSQEAIDYVNTVSVGASKIEQTVVSGTVNNGALFDLPAGTVGFAAGLEYREEKSVTEEPDNAVGTFFNALGEDEGEFDVTEAFVEFSVPLISDVFLIQDLNLEAAARYADYSTIGEATSWKLGLDWAVNDELRIRTTYSEALRAPNIGEIFGAASQTFYNIDDSCKSDELDKLSNSETRRANCLALGVPVDFNDDYDAASIEGLSSGNINLTEEKSESTTIGFVYQPSYLEGFSMTVDYWKIELTDAISSVSAQDIVDRCIDSTSGINNIYCPLITRNSTSNQIDLIQNSVLNLAGQDASGIDFEFGYDFELAGGTFKTTLLGTYLKERKSYPFQDEPEDFIENAGTTGEAVWQANLSLGYVKDNWAATLKTRYLEDVSLYTDQELEDNPNPSSLMSFPSYVVTDMTLGYNFENGINLTLGIDNLFDKDVPLGTTGTGSGSAGYDNIGRFGYLKFAYKM